MPSNFPVLTRLLSSNAQWARDVDQAEPGFFSDSAKGQSPKVLWIGCADSRVPESVVTASRPGEIFVHRNIANQFRLDDDSGLSVLAYAVNHLGVEHVVVVGHTCCGGAAASLSASKSLDHVSGGQIVTDSTAPPNAPINKWLSPLTSLAASLDLEAMTQDDALMALVEENVKAQVANLVQTETILDAWSKGKVWVHGWVYDIDKGTLRDLDVSAGPS